jgi:glycine/D-amino acid oxidase-like deaminating enzyme
MEVDFLLIGQGLAGTCLSYRLIEEGKSFLLIDLPKENKSSRVAAGIYNPITGRNLVKTWNADLMFPEIEPFFSGLEQLLDVDLLYKKHIYIPFLSIEEQNEWMGKSGEPEFEDYLQSIRTSSYYNEVNDPFGGVLLKRTGYVDISKLLDSYSLYLKNRDELLEEEFDEKYLTLNPKGISYNKIKAKSIIYCNGVGSMRSRFFKDLPFAPVKGEILDIEQEFMPEEIINRGVFRISLPNGKIRLGSTYSWSDMDLRPTEGAKKELLEKLDKLILLKDKKVIDHKTGMRPATKDRKPFLGKHPEYDNVYIFNGFGAKGVSLIPYYSKIMAKLLIYGDEPEKDVNPSRFFNYI